jgi:hypothetical protein
MFFTDLEIGDSIEFDDGRIVISLDKNKGQHKFKFGVEATKDVSIKVKKQKDLIQTPKRYLNQR